MSCRILTANKVNLSLQATTDSAKFHEDHHILTGIINYKQ